MNADPRQDSELDEGAGKNPADKGTRAAPPRSLRLWPAVVIGITQLVFVLGAYAFIGDDLQRLMILMFTPMISTLLLFVWWFFFSRVLWMNRFAGLGAVITIGMSIRFLLHESMADVMVLILYLLPSATTMLVVGFVISRNLGWQVQRHIGLAAATIGCAFWLLVQVNGIDGHLRTDMSWIWSPTAEETFLEQRKTEPKPVTPPKPVEQLLVRQPGDWPGFRGSTRDSRLYGVTISADDWDDPGPPVFWRRLIGPGWSSFCVVGHRLFTQEQRGENESVVCYDTESGDELWEHSDKTRFWEVVGGTGPRATPTFSDGRLFTFGATGILNCLDPLTGSVHWTRNVQKETGAEIPHWGFASSPLVYNGIVTVFTGVPKEKQPPKLCAVSAYDAESGRRLWTAGAGQLGYSSPHLVRITDVPQILMISELGIAAFDPMEGTQLWTHEWFIEGMNRVVQPAIVDGNSILIGTGYDSTRRITIEYDGSGWRIHKPMTFEALKPYFNDFVVHKNHICGFDGAIFWCVRLEDGKRIWRKGGRYGHGQVLLIVDQDLLVVVSETGEIILVEADPDELTEVARFQAIEGKTWNHPVIAHGKLFVRNGKEVACFDISVPTPASKQGLE